MLLQLNLRTSLFEASTRVKKLNEIQSGNALATVQSLDPIKILTIRPTSFGAEEANGSSSAKIEKSSASLQDSDAPTKVVNRSIVKSERPELASASIVVSGGRALKTKENFELMYKLADKLGGAGKKCL
jgi:electron transfer flavoprotein alpha subunit